MKRIGQSRALLLSLCAALTIGCGSPDADHNALIGNQNSSFEGVAHNGVGRMTIKQDLFDHASHAAISVGSGGSSSNDVVSHADSENDDENSNVVEPRGRELSEANRARGPPSGKAIDDPDYWYALIDEKAAATFLGLERRTMQGFRQRGGGPRYYFISSRCLRYRRIDLWHWAEARMRSSTSDPGSDSTDDNGGKK